MPNENENENLLKEDLAAQGQEPQDAVQAIIDLKKTTVPKVEYEKLQEEHTKLLKAYIDGGDYDVELPETDYKKTAKECREKLSNENLSNLEYAETALKLRKAVIDGGGVDPFIPQGKNIIATSEDKERAEAVATVLQECIDYAEGDSQVFTNELQRRTVDSRPIRR